MDVITDSTVSPVPAFEETMGIHILVGFIEPSTAAYKTRHFDLAKHDDKVAYSKFTLWAMHNNVEMRVRRFN